DVLADDASRPDPGALAHLGLIPDAGAFADLGLGRDLGGRVDAHGRTIVHAFSCGAPDSTLPVRQLRDLELIRPPRVTEWPPLRPRQLGHDGSRGPSPPARAGRW